MLSPASTHLQHSLNSKALFPFHRAPWQIPIKMSAIGFLSHLLVTIPVSALIKVVSLNCSNNRGKLQNSMHPLITQIRGRALAWEAPGEGCPAGYGPSQSQCLPDCELTAVPTVLWALKGQQGSVGLMVSRVHLGELWLLEGTGRIPKTAPAARACGRGHRLRGNEIQVLVIWNLIQMIPIL